MNNVTFYHDFPQTPEEMFDFPSHVSWSEKESVENITLIKTAENSWFIVAKEKKEVVLCANVYQELLNSEEDFSEEKNPLIWKVSDLTGSSLEELDSNSFKDVWSFLQLHSLNLPVNRHSEDEIPNPDFANRIRNKM